MYYHGAGLQLTIIQKRQQADVKVGHLHNGRPTVDHSSCKRYWNRVVLAVRYWTAFVA